MFVNVCLCMCIYIYVYIYIYIYVFSGRVEYEKCHLNAIAFLKCMVHFCCYVGGKFSTNYIPIKRKIKSVNQTHLL